MQAVLRKIKVRLSEQQRRDLLKRGKKVGQHARSSMYQLRRCPKCGTYWQRDVCGGSNIDQLGLRQQLRLLMGSGGDLRGKFSQSYEFKRRGKRHSKRRGGEAPPGQPQ